jgi:hypothetical protein
MFPKKMNKKFMKMKKFKKSNKKEKKININLIQILMEVVYLIDFRFRK